MTSSITGLTGPEQIDRWLSRLVLNGFSPDNHSLKHNLHEAANELRQTIPSNTVRLRREETAEYQKAARSLEVQYLIRRFVVQLRYGCENPKCVSKLCFTWRELHARYPVRRPSHLTARIMAHTLATAKDPYGKLCPNRLDPLPIDLDLGMDLQRAIQNKQPVDSPWFAYTIFWDSKRTSSPLQSGLRLSKDYVDNVVQPIHQMPANDIFKILSQNNGHDGLMMKLTHPSRPKVLWDYLMNSLEQNGVPKPDRKSLSQKLFSTLAMKRFEWRSSVTDLQILQENTGSENSFIISRTATALPVDSADATVARSICPSSPSAVLPLSGILQSEEGLDRLEVLLPESTIPSNLLSTLDESNEKLPVDVRASIKQLKPHQGKDSRGIQSNSEVGNTTATPKSRDHIAGQENSELDLAVSANNPQGPNRIYLVDLQGLLSNEQTRLTELTTLNLLAMRDACIDALPQSPFGPGQPEDISPALWQFVSNTLFQGLGTAEGLLRSFQRHEDKDPEKIWENLEAFHWHRFAPDTIMNYLWHGIEQLFTPPPGLVPPIEVKPTYQPRRRSKARYLNDSEALHMIMICIFALVGHMRLHVENDPFWIVVSFHINRGRPFAFEMVNLPIENQECNEKTEILDAFHSVAALRLASRLVRAIAARRSFHEMEHGPCDFGASGASVRPEFPLMNQIIDQLKLIEQSYYEGDNLERLYGFRIVLIFIDWMRMLILQNWDGQAEINRWETAGAAVEIMADIAFASSKLQLSPDDVSFEFLEERIDSMESATKYTRHKRTQNVIHLLNFPFLFRNESIIHNFRALNYSRLSDAYRGVGYMKAFTERVSFAPDFNRHAQIDTKLGKALSRYLVLDVRREHVLEDTMNQLWGREKRELLRPLKVQMGMDEGEQGQDQGGVSQEFFRVVFQKAFDPDAGLFITDPDSRMSWFQPMSMEPLATFELLGLLVSLGVYNGITLPVSFPLAFYARLLNQPSLRIKDIRDGWPALSKGLQQLLDWEEGDVSDVFVRDYVFSFQANGQTYHVDMDAEQGETQVSTLDAALLDREEKVVKTVTNENRGSYVADYISWLTDKSIHPQLQAFERGFRTCIDEKALSILTPAAFIRISEGFHDFEIAALEGNTQYEDYTADHPLMKAFWEIARSYTKEKQKVLLEFVTASDRVPANGMGGLRFVIKRNGGDAETLPQSATCFGSLLLPEYSSKEKLRTKLDIALEHSKGFGTL